MEKPKPEIDEIIEDVKLYIDTTVELYKLKSTEKGAVLAASTIIQVILGVFISMILLFCSLALAYFLSDYFERMYTGFIIVAGIYLLVAIIVILSKDKWLKRVLVDNIIKAIYSH